MATLDRRGNPNGDVGQVNQCRLKQRCTPRIPDARLNSNMAKLKKNILDKRCYRGRDQLEHSDSRRTEVIALFWSDVFAPVRPWLP